MSHKVYLLSSENKDYYCLDPLQEPLGRYFREVSLVDIHSLTNNDDLLAEICQANRPIFVYNSRISIEFLSLIMGSKPYISIGLEHGIAPYKKYTYGRHLIECDIYFAPTKLWADRLVKLYQPPTGMVQVGGYPRLHQLIARVNDVRQGKTAHKSKFWSHVKRGVRKLAIFSWHLDPSKLANLPDKDEIVYLLHPADAYIVNEAKFKYAKVVVSNPSDTAELLAYAELIAGDFSSMTIEAAATGIPTYLFIARSLYSSDCDMDPEFFQEGHKMYGRVPYSDFQLERDQICGYEQLVDILKGDRAPEIFGAKPLNIDSDFLPPIAKGDGEYISKSIKSYVEYISQMEGEISEVRKDNLNALNLVKRIYRQVLGRETDFFGAFHYLGMLVSPSDKPFVNAVNVIRDVIVSDEGRAKWEGRDDIPNFF